LLQMKIFGLTVMELRIDDLQVANLSNLGLPE